MTREDLRAMARKELEKRNAYRCRLLVCYSSPCLASGAEAVHKTLVQAVRERNLDAEVDVTRTGCVGPCSRGPLVTVRIPGREDVIYEHVTPEFVVRILEEHALGNRVLDEKVLPGDLPFFTKQLKVVLANSANLDPESLESSAGMGGFTALCKVLEEMTPEQVVEEIKKSGLRGRGGGGFPTGLKWDLVRKAAGDKKFIVANGDEGDPGAYMDRTTMESDPFLVLEGMAIAAYAVGADQGYIYVRAEYPLAAERLAKAIKKAENAEILGNRIFGSNFNFRVDIRLGAGAFVCGEETGLLTSVMGRRGQPYPRPPFPANSGLWGCPTLINNVETFGNIAPIINRGGDWYASIGTEKSKGTKIFALAGEINNTGLIEVPMGITLREVVYDIGGGIPKGAGFKAAQTGGPSGGCIPAQFLDTPIDYENLAALGSIMGSGGLVIMNDRSCMVDVARFFMDFCRDESCGKCIPCRVGTSQMLRLLERICNGSAVMEDLDKLQELAVMVQDTSLCGLGFTSPNPTLSTLRYFREEYEAHIRDRKCPVGVCAMNEVPLRELVHELPRRIREAGKQ
ncbi:MAG TPA: NADH-ubiquinone oxidoreductase-F iron-sulfur binding region domain-containing protein [Geobacteraceae bacterium]|mgnify:FL=1|nr:NADH-ubiquinone oxidoreductase-F iron-sulfur binding region domain-containing protein [Geobacteraceae bacterium]